MSSKSKAKAKDKDSSPPSPASNNNGYLSDYDDSSQEGERRNVARNMLQEFRQFYIAQRLNFGKLNETTKNLASITKEIKEKGVIGASEARIVELQAKLMRTPFLVAKDKLAFVLGISLLVGTEFIMVKTPGWMYHYYTLLLFPLLIYRFFSYHKANWHYFMLDFCYYMQVWSLLFYYVWPTDVRFFKIFFGLSNGPLLLAIIVWSNRLVFHDFDKITSLFIHICPPLLTYCTRWNVDDPLWKNVRSQDMAISFVEVLYMCLFYIIWQLLYFLKTEWIDYHKFAKDTTLMTSARWLSQRKPHPIYVLIRKRGFNLTGTQALCLCQLIYTALALMPVWLLWNYQWAHAAALLIAFAFSTWFGAQYYFEVFTENYLLGLEDKIKKFQAKPDGKKQTRDDSRYAPSSMRSVITFILYFSFGIALLLGTLKMTIWL